jgi:hypothetical protein
MMRFAAGEPDPQVARPKSSPFTVLGLANSWSGNRSLGPFEYSGDALSGIGLRYSKVDREDLWVAVYSYSAADLRSTTWTRDEKVEARITSTIAASSRSQGRPHPVGNRVQSVLVEGTPEQVTFEMYDGFEVAGLALDAHNIAVVIERSAAAADVELELVAVTDLTMYS